MGQWLGFRSLTAGSPGSVPCQGTDVLVMHSAAKIIIIRYKIKYIIQWSLV